LSHDIACVTPAEFNADSVELLVVGNSLSPRATEVEIARKRGIAMASGADVIREILGRNKRALVVTGTHGKTTSSALLAHVFITALRKPAYMIGGSFQGTGDSYSVGSDESKHLILEGDEYDSAFFDKAPKFLRYGPSSAIITSLEHDHVDLYPNFADYVQAFQFLVEDLPENGFLVVNSSVCQYLDLAKCICKVFVYGVNSETDISYGINSVDGAGTHFSVKINGKAYNALSVPLFGDYNIENATAVFALATLEGVEEEFVRSALVSYPGVHERQEILSDKNGVVVVRDFAHHPTAVTVTLRGLKERYPNRRIVCVFEPRSATSRRKFFEEKYPESFLQANVSIVCAPPFKITDDKENFMDLNKVKEITKSKGGAIEVLDSPENALVTVKNLVQEGDVVVFMSNGDFSGIPEMFTAC